MAKMVFSLRNVPDDEAGAVRGLLSENEIEFYETRSGNWGISAPGLWLRDPGDYRRARALIDAYESERGEQERARYRKMKAEGRHRTLVDAVKEQPLQFLLYLAFALFILYVSIVPFFEFGK